MHCISNILPEKICIWKCKTDLIWINSILFHKNAVVCSPQSIWFSLVKALQDASVENARSNDVFPTLTSRVCYTIRIKQRDLHAFCDSVQLPFCEIEVLICTIWVDSALYRGISIENLNILWVHPMWSNHFHHPKGPCEIKTKKNN